MRKTTRLIESSPIADFTILKWLSLSTRQSCNIAFYVNLNAQIIPFQVNCLFTFPLLFFILKTIFPNANFFLNNLNSYLLYGAALRTGFSPWLADRFVLRREMCWRFSQRPSSHCFARLSQSLFFLHVSRLSFSLSRLVVFDVKMLWNNHKNCRRCNDFFKVNARLPPNAAK